MIFPPGLMIVAPPHIFGGQVHGRQVGHEVDIFTELVRQIHGRVERGLVEKDRCVHLVGVPPASHLDDTFLVARHLSFSRTERK